jgi:acyl CoA:acetate/3-ketoacid CoA transferase alpha subunit
MQDIFSGDGAGLPWYAYAIGAALLIAFGKTVANVATEAIRHMEEEEAAAAAENAIVEADALVLSGQSGTANNSTMF